MTGQHCRHCGWIPSDFESALTGDGLCPSCVDRRMNVSEIAAGADAEFSRAETEMERRTALDAMAARLRGVEMTVRGPLIRRKQFHEGLFGHPWFESNPPPHAGEAFGSV